MDASTEWKANARTNWVGSSSQLRSAQRIVILSEMQAQTSMLIKITASAITVDCASTRLPDRSLKVG